LQAAQDLGLKSSEKTLDVDATGNGEDAVAPEQGRRLALINRAAQVISSDLDLDRIVQRSPTSPPN
jgi:hypothetical protein